MKNVDVVISSNYVRAIATAITFLFMKLGLYKDNCIYYNNKKLIDSNFKWNAPEVFKLNFCENDLQSIENIKIDY